MDVKKKLEYPRTLENYKKLELYLKKLDNGRTKANRQNTTIR